MSSEATESGCQALTNRFWRVSQSSLLILLGALVLPCLWASPGLAQSDAEAGAYGEALDVSLVPLLGPVVRATSGPLPEISGPVTPPPGQTETVAGVQVGLGVLGTILDTGVITVQTQAAAVGDGLSARAEVDGLDIALGGLLGLGADVVESRAEITGTCGSSLTATGTTTLANAGLSGLLGLGLTVDASPAPNTVLINLLGVRLILNEQTVSGDGVTGRSVSVNAIRLSLSNSLLAGLGLLTGEIVIAHSEARLACGPAVQGADLDLTFTSSPQQAEVGETVTHTLTATNHGPAATNGTLTITIPPGMSVQSVISSQGSCTGTTTITCNLGNLPSGAAATVTIRTQPTQPGTLVTTGTLTSPAPDPNPANNTASVSTTALSTEPDTTANLTVTKRATSTSVGLGENITYIITVSNQGPAAAPSVVVTDLLPARLTLVSATASQGTCDETAIPVICNLGGLAAGAQATVTILARAESAGEFANQVVVTSSVPDPDGDDNGDTSVVIVTGDDADPAKPPAGACKIDVVPAATLLIPYFEVDLSKADGRTTLFSVTNALAQPQLAHVTVWTDWGVPSLTYDLYLTGFDVETINLRDLLNGTLHVTGSAVSPRGSRSSQNTNLAGCNAQGVASSLTPARRDHLRAWHTGARSAEEGTCAASPRTSQVATGYITIDTVTRCSTLTPADSGYFGTGGVASNTNALWGDYFLVDPSEDSAQGDTAVHITADPSSFGNGNYTFYSRYVNNTGIDARQPLGTRYAARFGSGAAFSGGTKVILWRDPRTVLRNGLPCGQEPPRLPLRALVFDEEENPSELLPSTSTAPWATQLVPVGSNGISVFSSFGWMNIDLWNGTDPAQGWMAIVMSAENRYSVGLRAVRLDSACDF